MTAQSNASFAGEVVGIKTGAVSFAATSSTAFAFSQGGTKTGAVSFVAQADVVAVGRSNNQAGAVSVAAQSAASFAGGNVTKGSTATFAATTSVAFSGSIIGNTAPVATITDPESGFLFQQGESVAFAGSATDAQQGTLTGSALVWSSSLQGVIGTGVSFSRNDLSLGAHVITLTATDNGGLSDTATVSILVTTTQPGFTPSGSGQRKKTVYYFKHRNPGWNR